MHTRATTIVILTALLACALARGAAGLSISATITVDEPTNPNECTARVAIAVDCEAEATCVANGVTFAPADITMQFESLGVSETWEFRSADGATDTGDGTLEVPFGCAFVVGAIPQNIETATSHNLPSALYNVTVSLPVLVNGGGNTSVVSALVPGVKMGIILPSPRVVEDFYADANGSVLIEGNHIHYAVEPAHDVTPVWRAVRIVSNVSALNDIFPFNINSWTYWSAGDQVEFYDAETREAVVLNYVTIPTGFPPARPGERYGYVPLNVESQMTATTTFQGNTGVGALTARTVRPGRTYGMAVLSRHGERTFRVFLGDVHVPDVVLGAGDAPSFRVVSGEQGGDLGAITFEIDAADVQLATTETGLFTYAINLTSLTDGSVRQIEVEVGASPKWVVVPTTPFPVTSTFTDYWDYSVSTSYVPYDVYRATIDAPLREWGAHRTRTWTMPGDLVVSRSAPARTFLLPGTVRADNMGATGASMSCTPSGDGGVWCVRGASLYVFDDVIGAAGGSAHIPRVMIGMPATSSCGSLDNTVAGVWINRTYYAFVQQGGSCAAIAPFRFDPTTDSVEHRSAEEAWFTNELSLLPPETTDAPATSPSREAKMRVEYGADAVLLVVHRHVFRMSVDADGVPLTSARVDSDTSGVGVGVTTSSRIVAALSPGGSGGPCTVIAFPPWRATGSLSRRTATGWDHGLVRTEETPLGAGSTPFGHLVLTQHRNNREISVYNVTCAGNATLVARVPFPLLTSTVRTNAAVSDVFFFPTHMKGDAIAILRVATETLVLHLSGAIYSLGGGASPSRYTHSAFWSDAGGVVMRTWFIGSSTVRFDHMPVAPDLAPFGVFPSMIPSWRVDAFSIDTYSREKISTLPSQWPKLVLANTATNATYRFNLTTLHPNMLRVGRLAVDFGELLRSRAPTGATSELTPLTVADEPDSFPPGTYQVYISYYLAETGQLVTREAWSGNFTISTDALDATCSGQGVLNFGACTCNEGWFGPSCAQNRTACSLAYCDAPELCSPTTAGIFHCAPPVCVGGCLNGGACAFDGVNATYCTCAPGFHGASCNSTYTCSPACGAQGVCVGNNTCSCPVGMGGAPCAFQCSPACGAGSHCGANNTCACDEGFAGSPCAPVCSPACGDHGECVAPDECDCDVGYEGAPCALVGPVCSPSCGAHGACGAGSVCNCDEGYGGSACALIAGSCEGNCTGRGECVDFETCECDEGFFGDTCELDVVDCSALHCADEENHVCARDGASIECVPSPCHDGVLDHGGCNCAGEVDAYGPLCDMERFHCNVEFCAEGQECGATVNGTVVCAPFAAEDYDNNCGDGMTWLNLWFHCKKVRYFSFVVGLSVGGLIVLVVLAWRIAPLVRRWVASRSVRRYAYNRVP